MRQKSEIAKRLGNLFVTFFLITGAPAYPFAGCCQDDAGKDSSGFHDFLTVHGEIGRSGGTLVISQRSQPKTLNPLTATDTSSREIIGLLMADLIHINRATQMTEPALAKSWTASANGKQYTLHLRRGLRFSDGYPFTADDVVFTFQSYLDQKIHSPQRDLLVISGKPIAVKKLDAYTVVFTLAEPYAAAERLFDSIAILPRHVLQRDYDQGTLAGAWGLGSSPGQMAGLGPFRLKEYIPGQRIVLERNPFYWKRDTNGNRLPYLDGIVSLFVANADAQAMRFEAGETDIISGLNAADFAVLQKDRRRRHFRLCDLGPGLEYSFLFFNLNTAGPSGDPALPVEQRWFRQAAFRHAISSAIDRESIVRLAYLGRAHPLSVQVTPGNRRWVDRAIPPPLHSVSRARNLMRQAGFAWKSGSLVDSGGRNVKFSIAVNAGNTQQVQMATMIQQDLKQLGIEVVVIPLEFHTFLDRIFTTRKYEAAIMALVDGDADPNSEMNVLISNGGTHVWSLQSNTAPAPWQREIDRLMQEQLTALNYRKRKDIYDRVQELVWKNLPAIFLVSPNVLVGAKDRIGNFQPAILNNYTLWNVEQLFILRNRMPPESR